MVAALTAAVPLLLVVVLILYMRRPTNIAIQIDDDNVVVTLRGWDAVYCCRHRVIVPVTAVEGVAVFRRDQVPAQGLRWPGTGFPGVIRAGSYGFGANRDFWDVRRAPYVLVVQLKPGAEYRRLVLEVPDPQEQMLQLRPVLGPLDWAPAYQ